MSKNVYEKLKTNFWSGFNIFYSLNYNINKHTEEITSTE